MAAKTTTKTPTPTPAIMAGTHKKTGLTIEPGTLKEHAPVTPASQDSVTKLEEQIGALTNGRKPSKQEDDLNIALSSTDDENKAASTEDKKPVQKADDKPSDKEEIDEEDEDLTDDDDSEDLDDDGSDDDDEKDKLSSVASYAAKRAREAEAKKAAAETSKLKAKLARLERKEEVRTLADETGLDADLLDATGLCGDKLAAYADKLKKALEPAARSASLSNLVRKTVDSKAASGNDAWASLESSIAKMGL